MTDAQVLILPSTAASPTTSDQTITEELFEIRFRPNPRVVDFRGTWAQDLSVHLGLEEWEIDENRIDVFNKERSKRGFVSFRNCGFYVLNSPTPDFFADQGLRLLRFMLADRAFDDRLFVTRFGLRTRFATPFAGTFEELLHLYSNRVMGLTAAAAKVFDAELIDIGAPINFKTRHGTINTVSGPMVKTQMRQYFSQAKNLPEVALYLDLDYWVEPKSNFTFRDLASLVKRFSDDNRARQHRFSTLVLGQ